MVNDNGHKVMCLNMHRTKADNIWAAGFMPNYLCRTKFAGMNQVYFSK